MSDLFLIAPPDAAPDTFPATLAAVLGGVAARALLVPRSGREAAAYEALVRAVLAVAQPRDVAVLIEGTPGEVRAWGADGLHVTGGPDAVRAAAAALKPDFIVGATVDGTRHDAMEKAECGIDYVFFGPLSGITDPRVRELAQWWAETMEVPAVLSDPGAGPGDDAGACEFLAVGPAVWAAR